ncbi:hypothetical protein [Treponema pectinovorum]|uniref:hypothetical protein n=1 Tax=Treponema pectinovorum TaxID=164 RepID=UPI0011C96C47|nr:hypothetical protein [Treponema pectinovorum]
MNKNKACHNKQAFIILKGGRYIVIASATVKINKKNFIECFKTKTVKLGFCKSTYQMMPEKKNLIQKILIKNICKNKKKSVRKNHIQAGTTPGKCCIVTFSDRKSHFLMAKVLIRFHFRKCMML